MRHVIRYICILFGLALLWISTSRTAMQYLVTLRDVKNTWWGVDELDHGDLASLSYLYNIKQFAQPKWIEPEHAIFNGVKHTALYIHGDSYTRFIKDTEQFAGLSSYHFIDRNRGGTFHLDTTQKNILIIEISERYLRNYFSNLDIFSNFSEAGNDGPTSSSLLKEITPRLSYASFPGNIKLDSIFNVNINQNLQFNLFNYQFIMPMFGCKAAINYYLFHRASGDVVISADKKFLFLKETVSVDDKSSSYSPLPADEVSAIVERFNTIYDHYKQAGFNEAYLSIIPNSATINQPEGYNNLIPAIQNDPQLKIKVIDVYTPFTMSQELVYQTGDTHWNRKGLKIWLDIVNKKLTE
ncbi:MAG: hypothetical protein JWQ38_2120 [Flavipsychrobacter sp.]|nr:hypothetical protein [Flavipsychrobacter sp.]